jgi:hypothetical protein
MKRRNAKTTTVAFKAEEELARLLDQLPNKSAFIRKAILDQLGQACPLCLGRGVVSGDTPQQFAALLQSAARRPCDGCGGEPSLLHDPGELSAEDRTRLEQFFLGGPLYCTDCYQNAPECGECGWHITRDRLAEHLQRSHAEKN